MEIGEADRPATIEDFREEGRKNGLKAAKIFGELCIGPDPSKLMTPQEWRRIHEVETLPNTLAKMKAIGASDEELQAYAQALNSELDQMLMHCAQLGLLGIPATPGGLISNHPAHMLAKTELDKDATLAECTQCGRKQGDEDALENWTRASFMTIEEINKAQVQRAHQRVQNLYAAGLSAEKVNAYADAASEAFQIRLIELEAGQKG